MVVHMRHLPKGCRLLSLLLLSLTQAAASAQSRDQADPNGPIQALIAAHHGRVAMYAQQLNSGKTVAIDADRPVQTASTIKLAILWETLRQVALGNARWDEPLTLTRANDTAGSGILHLLDQPLTLTLKDVTTLMVIVSDNTATNIMIDRFPRSLVNGDMAAIGLDQTFLYKKVGRPAEGPTPPDQPRFGLGKTTPRQMAALVERIGRCDLNLPNTPAVPVANTDAACTVALSMLRNQFYRETIPRYLEALDSTDSPSGIASKTGSLDATRSDVAIVSGKSGPIVLAVYTYDNADQGWSVDNAGEVLIANIARVIVTAWSPAGIDGHNLVPGLTLAAGPPRVLPPTK